MTQTTETLTATDTLAAKHAIHKIQDLLSLVKAAAHAIAAGDLEDEQGAGAGIAIAAEEARSMLYELIDTLGLDKEPAG